jgi:hypothetical protein
MSFAEGQYVIMLSAIMLSVILINVVAPSKTTTYSGNDNKTFYRDN